MAEGLSAAEVAAYREAGFVVPGFRLPAAMVARLQRRAAALVRDNPGLGDEPMVSPHVPGSGVQGRRCEPGWIEFPTCPPVLLVRGADVSGRNDFSLGHPA